jgi:hypothetical protein
MKRYKSFGMMTDIPQSNNDLPNTTPINLLAPPQDVPQRIQRQEYDREAIISPDKNFRAIRNLQRHLPDHHPSDMTQQYHHSDMMSQYHPSDMTQQYHHSDMTQQYHPSDIPQYHPSDIPQYHPYSHPHSHPHSHHHSHKDGDERSLCDKIILHVNKCKKCRKRYSQSNSFYITIIIGLLLFIIFLLTKVIDKFS